ncbi:MAG: transposase [Mycobacterium sp.]|nr:transposase [Mycobacterium sp.]
MAGVDRNEPKRAASSESRYSLMEFMRDFPDDATCLEWLWRTRYSSDGEHATCPKCEVVRVFKRYGTGQRRQSWTCTGCGLHLHPTAGTIFHKSSTSLHLWFYAMYLMTSTRCGISAKQLERELGVTYKTAWRMFHLIRNELMIQDDDPMTGDVELDETYVGGKPRGREVRAMSRAGMGPMQAGQAAGRAKKTTVFGMVERGGRVAAHVVPPTFQESAFRHIEARILTEASIYTDEAAAYTPLGSKGYHHQRIHHAAKVYVQGDVHTNTIEGFWSLVKRGIGGTHHAVSAKYLQGYLNEYVWRYNRRNDGEAQFLSLIVRAAFTSS